MRAIPDATLAQLVHVVDRTMAQIDLRDLHVGVVRAHQRLSTRA